MATGHLLHVNDLMALRDDLVAQYGGTAHGRVSEAVALAFGHSDFASMTARLGVRGVPVHSFDPDAFLSALGEDLLSGGLPVLQGMRREHHSDRLERMLPTSALASWKGAIARAAGLCIVVGGSPEFRRGLLDGSMAHLTGIGRHVEHASIVLHAAVLGKEEDGQGRIERMRRRNPAAMIVDEVLDLRMAEAILDAARAHLVIVDLGDAPLHACLGRLGDAGRVERELLCAVIHGDDGAEVVRVRE